jgi:superfamily II DNA or RNA helicase
MSEDQIRLLDGELSYEHPQAKWIFTSSWGGRVKFLHKKFNVINPYCYILSGLALRAYVFLSQLEPNIEVTFNFPEYDRKPCKFLGELRPYQEDAKAILLNTRQGILNAAVRSGKTIITASALADTGIFPVIEFSPNLDCAYQTLSRFREFIDIDVGFIGDSRLEPGTITVCTIQSAMAAYSKKYKSEIKEKLPESSSHQCIRNCVEDACGVVVDESHHSSASEWRHVINKTSKRAFLWSLSGTAYRSDGHDMVLESVMGPIVYKIGFTDLIKLGYLVPNTIFWQELPRHRFTTGASYQTVYHDYIVHNNYRNKLIAQYCLAFNKLGKSVLIQVAHVAHGKELKNFLPNVPTLFGSDDAESRIKIWDNLRSKKLLSVITTLGGEALDLASLDVVIIAEGGMSSIATIQRLRNLTSCVNKTIAFTIDFEDKAKYLFKHATERLKIYESEPAFTIYKVNDIIVVDGKTININQVELEEGDQNSSQ